MNNKLGPRDGTPQAGRPGSFGRDHVVSALRQAGGARTSAEIAEDTGLHINTVRAALDELRDAGTVSRQRRSNAGRGRPSYEYRADGPDIGSADEYVALAGVLARTIAETRNSPVPMSIRAGRGWASELIAQAGTVTHPVNLLQRMGFAPESGAGSEIRLTRCPLLKVATDQPDVVCSVHLGMVQQMVEASGGDPRTVSLEPFAERGACRLRLPEHLVTPC